ncbi:reverse transcriptase [Purpureocillium lavendulum]|uniref:Reverse transcriptase n=1 Tax=Purpureocillium lavendulum TaxID=1247861 RepID=A0AB34FAG2_9HYPO|nr:reverse transcriptase [Purpureocillium lavendulum]
MKYGQQLEQESVPEWSLHNLDYNSLKHEIKVHTTRDQASAMVIPGHQDTSLRKFEDGLFDELCNQHDRVDLFVTSKADEISRRLEHLNTSIQRCIAKHSTGQDQSFSLKRQRRFAKYERELMRCGDDIQALSRFANAQIVAFRKILKKYRKWTGSTTLTSRFNDIVLGNSKSFTRRDFSALQTRYDALLSELRSAAPVLSDPGSPSSDEQPLPEPPSPGTARVSFDPFPPTQMGPQVKYWNEYDDGSDAGGPEDDYAIYINPSEDTSFPGMAYVQAIVSMPYVKAKQWFRPRHSGEWRPLLSSANTSQSYSSTAVDSEEEGYASSDGLPYQGYMTHYALPSVSEQRAIRYRERALLWGTVGSFIASFVLLGIAGILTSTGKRKLRVEVDAGVTVGIVVSLFCACTGLGLTLYSQDRLSLVYRLIVWAAFVASCLLNGMLLVLVLGNTP